MREEILCYSWNRVFVKRYLPVKMRGGEEGETPPLMQIEG